MVAVTRGIEARVMYQITNLFEACLYNSVYSSHNDVEA